MSEELQLHFLVNASISNMIPPIHKWFLNEKVFLVVIKEILKDHLPEMKLSDIAILDSNQKVLLENDLKLLIGDVIEKIGTRFVITLRELVQGPDLSLISFFLE